MRAMALVRDPEARVEDLSAVVSSDGALAVRVLRIAGSVAYAQRQPPRTLVEAIRRLGFQTLRKIIVAASCRQVFAASDPVAEALWAHALATGLAADELAVIDGEPRGGQSFLAGLLHDIGRQVLYLADSARYLQVAGAGVDAERGTFGMTHAEVGGGLALHWGLEEELADAILQHHDASGSPLALRIQRADQIAAATGYPSLVADTEPVEELPLENDDLLAVSEHVAGVFDRERALFD
jgi:HD-like signal output (HDOD) protein